ncbi:type IIL restriction-modification enzyme MmeI [Pseudoramibacter alactolyticus]|uniref:type IIL restriction-modification enzyme MmeI n=1 Tax=Pseudoramibacter alactolyticus TaxID=113287 RepID=UPI0036F22883
MNFKRRCIPIGFMTPDKITADSCSIICGANVSLMGVLSLDVHMVWMRTAAGCAIVIQRGSSTTTFFG